MHAESPLFLVVHGGYTQVIVGLSNGPQFVDTITMPHKLASRDLVLAIDTLLKNNNFTLQDLCFIAAHQGPGPFTTLRSVLATVNGLAFATQLPLIGVDGLDAFIAQEKNTVTTRYLSCILNAFCDDVYFALYDHDTHTLIKGCESITQYIARLKDLAEKTTLAGNAVALHRELIEKELQDQALIPENITDLATIESIAHQAYNNWQNNLCATQLLPLYLKDSSARLTTLVT